MPEWGTVMLRRLARWCLLLFSRPRVEHLEHPHGGVAFAGGRTAVVVRATGSGRLGVGPNARDITGGFAGVLFLEVPPRLGRTTVEVPVRSLLFRHTRTIVLDLVPAPPRAPCAPAPITAPPVVVPPCVSALPPIPTCHEVHRP